MLTPATAVNVVAVAPATRRRWVVVGVLLSLSMLTIIDRVCISAAKPYMSHALGLGDIQFGAIFGAFALGYAFFQIPAGYLADRLGPRITITAIVGMWSLFTGMTGVASAVVFLVLVRFLFGAAEAGAFPSAARAIRSWLPTRETGVAQGVLHSGSRLGAALGLILTSWCIAALGWRAPFFILAALGTVWAVIWCVWFRNTPEESSSVSETECAYIRAGRVDSHSDVGGDWWSIVRVAGSTLLIAQYFASNFTIFLCFSWLLPYLHDRYKMSMGTTGILAATPLLFGVAANWISGAVVDSLYRRGYGRLSRIAPATAGFLLAAAALFCATFASSVWSTVFFLSVAAFGVDATLSPSWTSCLDITRERTGTLTAAMNMVGNLGSFTSSVAFPLLLRWTGSPNVYFCFAAALNVSAAIAWIRLRERTSGGKHCDTRPSESPGTDRLM